MQILLLADIHGNYPALSAIDRHFTDTAFDRIVNCGDTVVYAPFGNEVIDWLIARKALSILGNTDKKVIKLLRGKSFTKPSKPEKRVMYTHAADQLSKRSGDYLQSLTISLEIQLPGLHSNNDPRGNLLGIFHGSPAEPHELLFATSPRSRFVELAEAYPYKAIVTGHSHSPYHFEIDGTHFINPGSVGRMFDGNPAACCAVLIYDQDRLSVRHYRLAYAVEEVTAELERQHLPQIYQTMYRLGKKLN